MASGFEIDVLLALVDHVPAMLAYWDAAQRCRFANKAYETWFGVNPAWLVGRHISELLGPLYPLNRPYIEGALRGQPQLFERTIPDPKGGPPRHSQAQYVPHVVDGVVQGFIVLVTDITARKQAEDARRAAERDLEFIFDGAPIGLARVELDGRWTRVNRVLCELLGYTADELAHLRFQDVTHPEDLESDLHQTQRLLAGELQRYSLEKRYLKKDGTIVHAMLHGSVVRDQTGQPQYFIAQIEDLTERKRIQERLMTADRLTTVGTLATGVAHEINNPLAYILSNLEYMQTRVREGECADVGPVTPPTTELLDDVLLGVNRVKHIVAALQTFAERPIEDPHPTDVVQSMTVALNMTSDLLRARARVVTSYDDVPRVVGDEATLAQVFINLLVNAAQSLPEGCREQHTVRVDIVASGPDAVAVTIADTGHGMRPEILRRAFEPFFTTREVGAGSGLGLSISRNLVLRCGGEIELESTPGKGTTARIRLRSTAA